MSCDAEMCEFWTGAGCICEVFDLARRARCADCGHESYDLRRLRGLATMIPSKKIRVYKDDDLWVCCERGMVYTFHLTWNEAIGCALNLAGVGVL